MLRRRRRSPTGNLVPSPLQSPAPPRTTYPPSTDGFPSAYASSVAPTWTEETFIDPFDAEVDLSHDRPGIISHPDIMMYIPGRIRACILHPHPVAQIQGFHDLFEFLNINLKFHPLRSLIRAYFQSHPLLRHHLRKSLTTFLQSLLLIV